MGTIMLNDLFNLSEEEINNCKISLNISQGKGGRLCLDSWLEDGNCNDGFWSSDRGRSNFTVGKLCLAFYKMGWSGDRYLFIGAGRITKVPPRTKPAPAEFEPIEKLQKYVGRLIIKVYKGNTNGSFNFNLRTYLDKCEVQEVLAEPYSGKKFPGFRYLRLTYSDLKSAIYVYREWAEVLKSQKGIYVIVDKAPDSEYSGLGRIYVGKASGDNGMLYDRWKNYVDTLTGGNKELKKIQQLKGSDYIKKYFQWSILEIFNDGVSNEEILEREKHWKYVLNSKNQGLNDNY